MADHLERTVSREPPRENTPIPTHQDLFDFIEDKWKGKERGPRFLQLKNAFGPGGASWKDATIHQIEFKVNSPVPSRPDMVEMSNMFTSMAQAHCENLGKPQSYVVLAVDHQKGADPYGIWFKKFRPKMMLPPEMRNGSDGEVMEDAMHRDILMREHREHAQISNEHVRFMYDAAHKYTGQIMALQQDIITGLRQENQFLNSQRLSWFTAMEEAASKKQEREIAAKKADMWMNALERGANFAISMIPVVTKTLERKEPTAQLPANGEQSSAQLPGKYDPSSESMAIKAFVEGLNNDQRCSLFGGINAEDGKYMPGIFTRDQVDAMGDVMRLQQPPSALDPLMPGGAIEVTMDQVSKALGIAGDAVLALNAIFQERLKQQRDAEQEIT
jgi:hypothetical protein